MIILLIGFPRCGMAKVSPQQYGISLSAADSAAIRQAGITGRDSLLKVGSWKQAGIIYNIQRIRPSKNLTPDFYLLTALCLILGLIRYGDPRYFRLLIGAYRGPGNGRQWRDMP